MPLRSEVDPIMLRGILPLVGILEVSAKDVATFRLAGTGIRDIVGFDPTGKNAIDLVSQEHRLRRAYRTYMPATRPCGYHGLSDFNYHEGIADTFESVGLPLAADSPGRPNFLIFTLESILGRHWQRARGSIIENDRNILQFIDIGAGIPPSVDAPADFLSDLPNQGAKS